MKMCNIDSYYTYKYEKKHDKMNVITIGTIPKTNNAIFIGTLTMNDKTIYMRTSKIQKKTNKPHYIKKTPQVYSPIRIYF